MRVQDERVPFLMEPLGSALEELAELLVTRSASVDSARGPPASPYAGDRSTTGHTSVARLMRKSWSPGGPWRVTGLRLREWRQPVVIPGERDEFGRPQDVGGLLGGGAAVPGEAGLLGHESVCGEALLGDAPAEWVVHVTPDSAVAGDDRREPVLGIPYT